MDEPIHCVRCGRRLPATARFCRRCGSAVYGAAAGGTPTSVPAATAPPTPDRRRPAAGVWLAIGAMAAAALLTVTAATFLSGRRPLPGRVVATPPAFRPIAPATLPAAAWPRTLPAAPPPLRRSVDFTTQVEPILAAKCLCCHGSTENKGGFRMHTELVALRGGDSAEPLYVVGRSGQSALIKHVTVGDHNNEFALMPPKKEKKPVTPEEVDLLRRWIDEGARWN